MDIRPLPADEAAVRRASEELWVPYNRDLAAAVEDHGLVEDADLVENRTEFWLDQFEEDYRAWVAVDGGGAEAPLADTDGEFVGFITTSVDESPVVFERPDRLLIGDFYVAEPYRGTGLARDLLDRAVERAAEAGCPEVELNVDADNERALAFYEKVGFEPRRYRMCAAAEELSAATPVS